MKKSKLIMSIATLCLAIAVLCFGVYAVQTVNYTLSGNITYEVTDAFVEVQTKLYKSTSYLTSSQLGLKVNEVAESDFTTTPAGLTLVDTSAKANSTSGTLDAYSKTDLSFSTQAGSECYAYFFVTNIKNMSSEKNVWAVMQDDLTNPTNTVERDNGLQQTIDTTGKNMVIGVGIDNPGNPIPADATAFSYGIKIGVGDLATQDFNLAKLTFPTGTVAADRSNMKGVVVIPGKNPTTGEAITAIKGNSWPNSSSTAGFASTNFTTIAMADNIQTIDNFVAFANNQLLTNVILSKNLTSIGNSAFGNCPKLSSITIPSSVTSIQSNAFEDCGTLRSISIPIGVTSIGSAVFSGCTGLESIIVETGNTAYTSKDKSGSEVDCLIEISTNTLINGCKNSVIPNDGSIKIIGDCAFSKCLDLKSINLPTGLEKIMNKAFKNTGLSSIIIPEGVIYISNQAFMECLNLTSVVIPSTVETMNSPFVMCPLNNVTIDGLSIANSIATATDAGYLLNELTTGGIVKVKCDAVSDVTSAYLTGSDFKQPTTTVDGYAIFVKI